MSPRTMAVSFVSMLFAPVIGVAVIAAVWFAWTWWQPPARVVHGIEILTPQVPVGGMLEIRADVTVNRVCNGTIHRFIVDANGGVAWSTMEPPQANQIGAHMRPVNKIHVPEYLQPGEYTYRGVVYDNCGSSVEIALVPRARFEIVPRT